MINRETSNLLAISELISFTLQYLLLKPRIILFCRIQYFIKKSALKRFDFPDALGPKTAKHFNILFFLCEKTLLEFFLILPACRLISVSLSKDKKLETLKLTSIL